MRRITENELTELLLCPNCKHPIGTISINRCTHCSSTFIFFKNKPVYINNDNEVFPLLRYASDKSTAEGTKKTSLISHLKKYLPKKSINLARKKIYSKINSEIQGRELLILVLGSGNQTAEIEANFTCENTKFVFCDIDKKADVDIFCDAHNLPFVNECFDGVISTAVMEHVFYPETVAEEIRRVLKLGGFIYSEIPFLQAVHEGAYDITRFAMTGHRRLFEFFQEEASGLVAGPATALVWSIVGFFSRLSSKSKISSILTMSSTLLFSWIKYFDYLIQSNPKALDVASCTFFYGKKSTKKVDPSFLIHKYEGNKYSH